MTDPAIRIYALAQNLGAQLAAQGLTVVTAESCTAGGVAYAITQIAGSSAWFQQGMVVYSNEAKQSMLGVSADCLREYGAVSEPVARAMALGALGQSGAQLAVAVSGIAGPGGGSLHKPVGTVCFAWAAQGAPLLPADVITATRHFPGDRAAVRTASIVAALEGLLALAGGVSAAR